jgi:hypothetical protein
VAQNFLSLQQKKLRYTGLDLRYFNTVAFGEKVRTTNFTTSKTKNNIKKVGDDHYIEKIYKSDQNIEIQKDQNIESDLPMAFCLLNLT